MGNKQLRELKGKVCLSLDFQPSYLSNVVLSGSRAESSKDKNKGNSTSFQKWAGRTVPMLCIRHFCHVCQIENGKFQCYLKRLEHVHLDVAKNDHYWKTSEKTKLTDIANQWRDWCTSLSSHKYFPCDHYHRKKNKSNQITSNEDQIFTSFDYYLFSEN